MILRMMVAGSVSLVKAMMKNRQEAVFTLHCTGVMAVSHQFFQEDDQEEEDDDSFTADDDESGGSSEVLEFNVHVLFFLLSTYNK